MPAKKTTAKKAAAKKTATKKTVAKKAAAKKAPAKKAASSVAKKVAAKKKAASASAGFSLEDALSVAKKRVKDEDAVAKKKAAKEKARKAVEDAEQQAEKRVLGAASLSDILGFDPMASTSTPAETRTVPKKFKKFYSLLVELRDHVKTGLNMHTEETLKRSSKDDAGDLSGYSQHMADAGTDTFDRDFALSMVSSEQDALTEIEAAIERIFNGTYGICEMTGKQIREERLLAVPFTRYSVKTQTQLEKNQTRSVQRGGVFADATSEDAMTLSDGDSDS
jgi:DnaK suppressor protein